METITKPKSEGRVAAGKRLVEWNRKKKEDLLKNKAQEPSQVAVSENQEPNQVGVSGNQVLSSYMVQYGALAVILLAIGGYIYYTRKQAVVVEPTPEKPEAVPVRKTPRFPLK